MFFTTLVLLFIFKLRFPKGTPLTTILLSKISQFDSFDIDSLYSLMSWSYEIHIQCVFHNVLNLRYIYQLRNKTETDIYLLIIL